MYVEFGIDVNIGFFLYLQQVTFISFVILLPFYIDVYRVDLDFRLHSITHAVGLLI